MKSVNWPLIATVICSVAILSGCVSQKDSMIKQGYPVDYADGFEDGCHSGKKAGGSMFDQFKKDVSRFEKHQEYTQGWSDGFRQCESEQEALERQIRMSIEQQKLTEQKEHDQWEETTHDALKGVDTESLKNLK